MSIDIIRPNAAQMQEIASRPVQFDETVRVVSVPQAPAIGAVTTISTSAIELKIGGSALTNRSRLRVRNPDPSIAVRIGGSGITEATGMILEPLGTIEFEFDKTVAVPLFARSMGYEVILEVMES